MDMMALTPESLRGRLLPRARDSHKGDYGHLLLVCGCRTMPGAAVLATGAALHAGCGLVTLHATERALQATANLFPSAILSEDPASCFSTLPAALPRYTAIAVGPGLGTAPKTQEALRALMTAARAEAIPMVLDADALNILALQRDLFALLPSGSILTPHPGELRRLFSGETPPEADIHTLCRQTGCLLVEKGAGTRLHTPSGDIYRNTTGNPGLAKGGSGDVLTGLIGGLLARGYAATDAAALGVWIHGYAGDCLTESRTAEGYDSRDLIDALWRGFAALTEKQP